MAKLKAVKTLETVLTDMFRDFGIAKVSIGTDDAYYHSLKEIVIQPYIKEENCFFDEFVEERFGIQLNNSMLMGLLHELGHHETMDDISETIQDMCEEEVDRIETEMGIVTTEAEVRRLEWQYFTLPNEIIATYWAVDFIKNNPDLIRYWNRLTTTAMKQFYKVNNIIDED